MAKKDFFGSRDMSDLSYLLDTSVQEKSLDTPVQQAEGNKEPDVVKISSLVPFKDHPFRVETEGEDFEQLVDSIRENGLIYPILVRPVEDKYEIIAGHRRVAACKEAGLSDVPAIIRPMDDFDATILMVHSNFYREKIRISEKAKAYRMCMDAEKHQGKRGADTASLIGKEQDSKRQVYRYIRLSYLSDEFLLKLDEGKLAMNVGVELSYLDEETQAVLLGIMDDYSISLSINDAEEIRKLYQKNGKTLGFEALIALLIKPEHKKEPAKVTFKTKDIKEYFPEDTDTETMSNVIIRLLEKYQRGEFGNLLEE